MAPVTALSSHERTRVEDYLNDKIQVSADLESLDSLLSSLRAQQELQRKQLSEAGEALSNATKASREHAEATRKQAEAFAAEQDDIDRRLKAITQSETSDEAARSLEKSMEKLHRLEVSKGYVELLKEAEQLSNQALDSIASEPRAALGPYAHLRKIVGLLKSAQPAAEGAAPHLVDYTDKLASALRQQMKKYFGDRLQKTLQELKWPTRELNVTDQLLSCWRQDVELLLDLQTPELQSRDASAFDVKLQPPVLFPLEVMVHHLDLRFQYHFSGDKPTNRLDKPEYFLAHIMDLINQHGDFFTSHLQPVFDERAQLVGPSLEWNFYNASHSFITALLPMLTRKISLFLPQISTYPQLLSHFIHELMKFDNEIRDTWSYMPDPYAADNWKGMTWDVLTKQGWYDRWLQVEKDFALVRYKDIIDTADSGEIDYDGMEPIASKPTKAAIRVNDLLETITERYQPLSSFGQKLRFLIDIQITIFDQFHERLFSALEAYLAMTSTIGRTVQGADGQASVEGVAGLERLCRVFGSAEYLERKMEDWSNDVFFVELWSELQDRVRQNQDSGRNVAGTMSVAEVASRTSPAVTNNGTHIETSSDGALFDETASAYRRLRLRSEAIITSTLSANITSALRPYSRVSTWATISTPSSAATGSPLSPTSDLAPGIRALSTQLSFLSRALGTAPLRRVSRQLLLSIQSYIWDHVLARHTFSATGAAQLASDVEHLCSVVDSATGASQSAGVAMQTLKRLNEGLRLLCLPAADSGDTSTEKDDMPRLWDVENKLFMDNESARGVLAELEIETLSEAEARSVLERRAEVGN
ncbi:hypothetical protein N7541_001850 [Penicillium brevicompactum]|uniref:RINT-1 family protein n=1 Tax=Penicillium brevicompactum TaxID=5074 RepID=A0A9W9RIZ7_PENBR|nr:hypothetical protein N7541_001850 [Penicillium brevicompactum]